MRFSRENIFATYPGVAISLYAQGHRNDFGTVYAKIYRDIQARWGNLFVTRNANGRISKITGSALAKEEESLLPASTRRHPNVAIAHFSNTEGDEVPTYFELIYSDISKELCLLLFLENQEYESTEVLGLLQDWLEAFPLFCGSVSPAFAHAGQANDSIAYIEYITARANNPGFQFAPFPPLSENFDGLSNWGELTLLGSALTAKLGGIEKMRETLPDGFSLETIGTNSIVRTSQFTCSEPANRLTGRDRSAFQALADWLALCRNSSYTNGYIPMQEWNRMSVSWRTDV
jgi:hypothetical protein